jgi:hypothetical protein
MSPRERDTARRSGRRRGPLRPTRSARSPATASLPPVSAEPGIHFAPLRLLRGRGPQRSREDETAVADSRARTGRGSGRGAWLAGRGRVARRSSSANRGGWLTRSARRCRCWWVVGRFGCRRRAALVGKEVGAQGAPDLRAGGGVAAGGRVRERRRRSSGRGRRRGVLDRIDRNQGLAGAFQQAFAFGFLPGGLNRDGDWCCCAAGGDRGNRPLFGVGGGLPRFGVGPRVEVPPPGRSGAPCDPTSGPTSAGGAAAAKPLERRQSR